MRKLKRSEAPEFLTINWQQWGIDWEKRHKATPGAAFHWHEIGKEKVNHKLLPFLKEMTQNHCSFCDIFPVNPPSNETIEHFKPKTIFHREAYKWENLYYCCDACQNKGSDYNDDLIPPDAEYYSFDRFFRWDYTLGTLEVNEKADEADKIRARETIKAYSLNSGHPALRRRAARQRAKMPDEPIDDFAYRDFISNAPTE